MQMQISHLLITFLQIFLIIKTKLKAETIECVRDQKIVCDIFNLMCDSDFRNQNGELMETIFDTSSEANDSIGNRSGDIDGADVNAIKASANVAANKIVRKNKNYNEGFARRMELYNNHKTFANNEYRTVEIFVPLNRLFQFCAEFNRVLKYIPLEIILTRSGFNDRAFFGAAGTNVDFSEDNNGGITSISLMLQTIKFRPDIEARLEKAYSHPFNVTYYKRICEKSSTSAGSSSTFGHIKSLSIASDGRARFVICIMKPSAQNTKQQSYQLCPHCNVQNILVNYNSQDYPQQSQEANFLENQFTRF